MLETEDLSWFRSNVDGLDGPNFVIENGSAQTFLSPSRGALRLKCIKENKLPGVAGAGSEQAESAAESVTASDPGGGDCTETPEVTPGKTAVSRSHGQVR